MKGNTELKTRDLMLMALIAFGIQFVNSLLIANMSSIYRFLQAPGSLLPLLGLAAPVAGLVIQPLVGQLSDITSSRIGKRHPYLLIWTILAVSACFLVPFSNTLPFGIVLIWIISCSVNGAIETLRALTGDVVPDQQKTNAFAWQTIFAGMGAAIAAILPWFFSLFEWQQRAPGIPLAIKLSFLLGGIAWLSVMRITFKPTLALTQLQRTQHSEHMRFSIVKLSKRFAVTLLHNIKTLPKPLIYFGLIQFFTWMGMFTLWLYFSSALAQHLYGMPSNMRAFSTQYASVLETATVKTNFFFGIYQFVSVLFALIIPLLNKFISSMKLHGIALSIGAISILVISITTNLHYLMLGMCGIGILWGSLMTLPYAIISAGIPQEKMGTTFGLFNISITLPQIITGLLLKPAYVYIFHQHATHLIFLSGTMIMISSILTLLNQPNKNPLSVIASGWQNIFMPKVRRLQTYLKNIHSAHYGEQVFDARKKNFLVLVIIFLMTLGQLAITIYLPAMPAMEKAFGTHHFAIQSTLTIYLMGYGFSQFIYGPLSDIYGRRVVIIGGLIIFMLASIICVASEDITWFLIARLLQGIGMGCGDTMGRAILCDRFQHDAFIKAAAKIGMAATITPFVGPLIGGYLQTYFHWRLSFGIMLLYCLFILSIVFYLLPETKPRDQFSTFNLMGILKSYRFILSNRVFLGFFIPGLVCFVGEILYNIVSPFLIQQELGYSAIAFGWLTLFTITGLLIGTVISHWASHRIKHDAMVLRGLLVLMTAGLFMVIPSLFHYLSLFVIIFPMTVFMIGVGIIYPNTNMGALTPFTAIAGVAGALQGGLQMLIGGMVATHLSRMTVKSALPLSMSLFLFSTVGFLLFYLLIHRNSNNVTVAT